MDLHVLSCLYGTITTDLFDIVTTATPSAHTAWVALEQQFIGNRETRVQIVDTEFRTLCQGALSVTDYCRRMKTLADSLIELGEAVPDRVLAMNVLRGLSERFHTLRLFLKKQRPLPTFVDIRSELLLEELTMASAAPQPPTALVASGAPASDGSSGAPSTGSSSGGSGSSGGGNRCRRLWRAVRRQQRRLGHAWWWRFFYLNAKGCQLAHDLQSLDRDHPDVAWSGPRVARRAISAAWAAPLAVWATSAGVRGLACSRFGSNSLAGPWSSWAATCSSSCCCSAGLLAHACCWRYWPMGLAGPCQCLQHHDSNTSVFVW